MFERNSVLRLFELVDWAAVGFRVEGLRGLGLLWSRGVVCISGVLVLRARGLWCSIVHKSAW